MKAIKEIIFWILAVIFAGVMFAGVAVEFDAAPWVFVLVKLSLFMTGFVGCVWASNKTSFLGRYVGKNNF